MTSSTLHLLPDNDLQDLKRQVSEIKQLLKRQPQDQFKQTWIESKEVPALLGISPRTWQSWRDKRLIPFSQFGAKIFVNLNDLNSLLESNRIETLKAV